MAFYIGAALYIWQLFQLWLHTIFVTPIQNMEMLWILVPVWLGWFFAEFFQEKIGTSMGNAISNAVIMLWGSVDSLRQTMRLITNKVLVGFWDIVPRFALIALIFGYGTVIVVLGWKGNKIIKYIGRVRELTYVFAMFVPVFYNAIPFSWNHIIAAVLFFPLFYFAIELLDKLLPNPKAIREDLEESSGSGSKGLEGMGDLGKEPAEELPSPPEMPEELK